MKAPLAAIEEMAGTFHNVGGELAAVLTRLQSWREYGFYFLSERRLDLMIDEIDEWSEECNNFLVWWEGTHEDEEEVPF